MAEKISLGVVTNILVCQHKDTGLKAFIAIHDTTLGPAVGGCRMWPYDNEEDAIEDALRLARGMTYNLHSRDFIPMQAHPRQAA